jgi:hypothetical protein
VTLFYLAGSCALGPHIALEYSGLAYETVRLERGKQTDPAYLAINLKWTRAAGPVEAVCSLEARPLEIPFSRSERLRLLL